MPPEDLSLLHRVVLQIEKERLWREISEEAEQDRQQGFFNDLPKLLADARRSLAPSDLLTLSDEDKLHLVGELWKDGIGDAAEENPALASLIEARLAAYQADPERVAPWADVKARLLASRRWLKSARGVAKLDVTTDEVMASTRDE